MKISMLQPRQHPGAKANSKQHRKQNTTAQNSAVPVTLVQWSEDLIKADPFFG